MKLFTIKLSETEREAMEAHRIRLGLRSGAETIRALLLGNGMEILKFSGSPQTLGDALGELAARTQLVSGVAEPRSPVKPLSRPAFNPQPKLKTKGK